MVTARPLSVLILPIWDFVGFCAPYTKPLVMFGRLRGRWAGHDVPAQDMLSDPDRRW
jgi:hypothetical protein